MYAGDGKTAELAEPMQPFARGIVRVAARNENAGVAHRRKGRTSSPGLPGVGRRGFAHPAPGLRPAFPS